MSFSIRISHHTVGKTLMIKREGKTYIGPCVAYIPANDNDPEIDFVAIELPNGKNLGFLEDEIDSIAII